MLLRARHLGGTAAAAGLAACGLRPDVRQGQDLFAIVLRLAGERGHLWVGLGLAEPWE